MCVALWRRDSVHQGLGCGVSSPLWQVPKASAQPHGSLAATFRSRGPRSQSAAHSCVGCCEVKPSVSPGPRQWSFPWEGLSSQSGKWPSSSRPLLSSLCTVFTHSLLMFEGLVCVRHRCGPGGQSGAFTPGWQAVRPGGCSLKQGSSFPGPCRSPVIVT